MLKSFSLPVQVAKCDINHGIPKSCSKCPIARRVSLALTSRFRRWDKVRVKVDGDSVDVSYRDARGLRHKFSANTPASGNAFIGNFDRLERVRVGRRKLVQPTTDVQPFGMQLEFSSVDAS